MLTLILLSIFFVLCSVCSTKSTYESNVGVLSFIGAVLSGICLILMVLAAVADNSIFLEGNLTEYKNQKQYIDSHYNSQSAVERVKSAEYAVQLNKSILQHREKQGDLFWGVFFPKEIADLQTFDLTKFKNENKEN